MKYFCCDDFRRNLLEGSALNGIDYLEVLDKDAPIFSAADFLNALSLVGQLSGPPATDHLSPFLWNQFSTQDQQDLTNPGPIPQKQSILARELNKVIQSGIFIYDPTRFSAIILSSKTLELLAQKLQGTELTRLNRLLLEDAYPLEIAKSPDRQRILFVHFINDLTGPALTAGNVLIAGGVRIRNIAVVAVTPNAHGDAKVLAVEVDQAGDFSTYTLSLVQDADHPAPPPGYDPVLSSVDFSFKVECPSDFDCQPARLCPKEPALEPEIDYLAKDYSSFRRLLLDRMTLLMPQWRERHPADLGIALVELLAFVGDYLSYQQDAIATEAYLGTARRRISVRRHARLVDYLMHDGCNARAWVQIQVSADTTAPLPKRTRLLTRVAGQPVVLPDDPKLVAQADAVFETMYDVPKLFNAHNEMHFYTWANQRCCLPKGSLQATLDGAFQDLQVGDVLVFEEILGPLTGSSGDADPSHRHAVRLTQVTTAFYELKDAALAALAAHGVPNAVITQLTALKNKTSFTTDAFLDDVRSIIGDAATEQFRTQLLGDARQALVDPLNGDPITEIKWADDDALPFPVCISAKTDEEHGEKYLNKVSVARGNIVLADHGLTTQDAPVPDTVPQPSIFRPPITAADRCAAVEPVPVPPRYNPRLRGSPVTQAAPFDPTASASAALAWNLQDVAPQVSLESESGIEWLPQRDLFNSDPDSTEFVVEVEADGTPWLRFGDGDLGQRPDPNTTFTAKYRTGNGVAGNVGAEALGHVISGLSEISLVRNPLPATGGVEPESIEDVRQHAPAAFRIQERAVTKDDYAEVTGRDPRVQRAKATFRWTGSWHTAFLTVDRVGGLEVDAQFKNDIRSQVERYRMAGYDLEVDGPTFVPLDVAMHVCVQPDHFRGHVEEALLELFSSQVLPDGRRGLFYPDNFTFGQTVYLSKLYAAAQALPGVASVQITKFQRRSSTFDPQPLADGEIQLGRLEIAQLDNDRNFPERGLFTLTLGGGK